VVTPLVWETTVEVTSLVPPIDVSKTGSVYPLLTALVSLSLAQGPFKVSVLNDTIVLTWTISDGSINLQVEGMFTDWVGIGWHAWNSSGQEFQDMYDVDFTIADFENGNWIVTDRKANNAVNSGYTEPVLDTSIGGSNDVTAITASQNNGITQFAFTKKLDTGDTIGDWPLQDGGITTHVIVAHGQNNTNTLAYHGPFNRGHWLIDFYTGVNQPCTIC